MRFFLSALALVAFGACTGFVAGERTFDRTLTFTGPIDLDVRSDVGGIMLTTGSSRSMQVHAVLRPQYGWADIGYSEEHIRELERNPPIEQIGNRIRIGYVRDATLLKGVSMRLEIQAPPQTQIVARAESGAIRVDGIDGPVDSQTSSGRIEITNIGEAVRALTRSGSIIIHCAKGSVSAHDSSGSIRIDDIDGAATSQTDSGRIEITDIAGEVRASTHSGSIIIRNANAAVFAHDTSGRIEATRIAGPIDAETTSGAILLSQTKPASVRARAGSGALHVKLAPGGAYTLEATSESGKVFGPKTKVQGELHSHRYVGTLGVGGSLVTVSTDSGRIVIE